MVKKKPVKKTGSKSWENLGKNIGKKIEEEFKKAPKSKNWCGSWDFKHKEHCGGFGRLIFSLGLVFGLNYAGLLEGFPTWTIVLMVIGFVFMRL
jgi:hypothetical protein